ncbi:MAG: zinc-ribbon and DUF3426 domain-containing protein [Burkholderiales bacterium]|nr:zinc-ribbon and DUF3426 domain-containing protein [Burkholderiales bacterium]
MSLLSQASAVTQCPHCGARFRVRSEHVKAHAGLVRCGACRGIFDAIEHLIEGSLPPVTLPEDNDFVEPPRTIVQAPPAVSPALTQAEAAAPANDDVAIGGGTREPSSTVAHAGSKAGGSPATAEPRVRNLDAQLASDTSHQPLRTQADAMSGIGDDSRPPGTGPTGDYDDYRWRAPSQPASMAMRVVYTLLSVVALLGLVAQGAWFFHDEIASKLPALNPALAQFCDVVGCRLQAPRRADHLGFVGADLAADPAHKGLLIFTATLRNSGREAVAFPHLVLSLDGVGGEAVVRRVFAPAEFIPATAKLTRGLDGGAEVEVKLYLDASQVNVVGFKVDHAYL